LEPLAFGLVHPSVSKIKIKIRFEDRIGLVLRIKTKGNTYSDEKRIGKNLFSKSGPRG
jgi:hypothetical protein